MCITSHVGPVVRGAFPEEEKVEQEVLGGSQAPSCEALNPVLKKGKPGAYRSYRVINMTCFTYLCMC
jgi:hypothetical protein